MNYIALLQNKGPKPVRLLKVRQIFRVEIVRLAILIIIIII